MQQFTKREFLCISAFLPFYFPLSAAIASTRENILEKNDEFPITVAVLKSAYIAEKAASEHYIGYSRKAVEQEYPNIAYLFSAFAVSEKIHADNYMRLLTLFKKDIEEPEITVSVSDTQSNLIKAAESEIKKIEKTYKEFLSKLKIESHDQAVVHCMYSWKSHRQHKQKINEILKYSKYFFGPVAQKIEGMKFDFHVCEICGSTIDIAPEAPCDICNYPISHYNGVKKPFRL
jgi:rubrerythrin